jgi:hypothetical protein
MYWLKYQKRNNFAEYGVVNARNVRNQGDM